VAPVIARLGGVAVVDVSGIGAGVVDRLRELSGSAEMDGAEIRVDAFSAGSGSHRKDRSGEWGFADRRSQAWWGLRELLDPAFGSRLCLPPSDLLIGDLTSPRWREMAGAKIKVESKDDIKPRLGRSTDDGDAVVQAFDVRPPSPLVAPVGIGRGEGYGAYGDSNGEGLGGGWGTGTSDNPMWIGR
jgi:hypothetical protein